MAPNALSHTAVLIGIREAMWHNLTSFGNISF